MRSYRHVALALGSAVLACAPVLAWSQSVPVWQRLLRWGGGPSSETPVETMMMGEHMQMSVRRDARPDDSARADAIVAAARRVFERYADVTKAEAEGYQAFAPRGVLGEEVHYTNMWVARRERKTLDLERPGSILYLRTAAGMKAVGVMYTADVRATTEELESRAPLGGGRSGTAPYKSAVGRRARRALISTGLTRALALRVRSTRSRLATPRADIGSPSPLVG